MKRAPLRLHENRRPRRPAAGITENRWRKEFGGLQVDQARRLKELEQENAK